MVGQTQLLKTIDSLIEQNKFPQFTVLEGMTGSGRTLMANYIAEKLEANLKEVEELKIANTREIIDEAKNLSFKVLYLFRNVEGMNLQAENSLLKLAEEPTPNCYLIMTVENSSSLLPTIQSRAKILKMNPYTDSELLQVTNRRDLIKICKSPGMIKLFESCDADDTLKFADKILNNISKISIMNMLTILTYIDIDGKDDSKYNRDLILKALEYKVYNLLISTKDKKYTQILRKIYEVKRNLVNNSINKQSAFDDLLFTIREVLKIEG